MSTHKIKPTSEYIRWPDQFIDPVVLSTVYAPYIHRSQQELQALFPVEKLNAYDWFKREQPSFILLPIFFLYLSEHLAPQGITAAHEKMLTAIMLNMEICAILDDCVDQTPRRSGGAAFYAAHGLHVTPSFITVLITKHLAMHNDHPSIQRLASELLYELSEREIWEYEHRYPDVALGEQWLENRYSEVTPAIVYVFNAACELAGVPVFDPQSLRLLAELFQDVDDVVNLLEQRSLIGENNDILMGMVTHPLKAALNTNQRLGNLLPQLWQECQLFGPQQVSTALWQNVYDCVVDEGVPETVDKIIHDSKVAVDLCIPSQRVHMHRIVSIFTRRIAEFV